MGRGREDGEGRGEKDAASEKDAAASEKDVASGGREAVWRTGLFWALRLVLGGLLVWSGAVKVGDPAGFANEIGNYHLLPSLSPIMAVTLPWIEIVIGVALIAAPRAWARAAALGAVAILGVFTIAVISVVARGIDVDCGCFGSGSGPVTMLTVLRDVALVAAAMGLFVLAGDGERSLPPGGGQVGAAA